MIEAYCRGYYPMGEDDGSLHWITSDPRFVLPIGALHVPKSLARLVRRQGAHHLQCWQKRLREQQAQEHWQLLQCQETRSSSRIELRQA
ncbi:MAG: hypothetical protein ACO3QC_02130, partial [Phycisphaerales bacterium]